MAKASVLAVVTVATASIVALYYIQRRKEKERNESKERKSDETITPSVPREISTDDEDDKRILVPNRITIAHGSMTGTCTRLAQRLSDTLTERFSDSFSIQVGSIQDWDWFDELLNPDDGEQTPLLILLIPTYTQGSCTPTAQPLFTALQDIQHDWRIENRPLHGKLRIACFGMGSSEYADNMGKPAREAWKTFQTQCNCKILVRLL